MGLGGEMAKPYIFINFEEGNGRIGGPGGGRHMSGVGRR